MMGVAETDPIAKLSLPPGFRFYPTDEELLVQYLCRKVAGHEFSLKIIGEIDLYRFDPWVLPSKAVIGEKEWYFFSPRDRKYPNGSRPNRVAGSGYWKATGTDKVITSDGRKVGIKKALVFYVGRAPKGTKTNWIMHEYRLIHASPKNASSSKLDEWVLCRIYKKNSSAQKPSSSVSSKGHSNNGSSSSSSSQFDDMRQSLPELDDRLFFLPRMNSLKTPQHDDKMGFHNLGSGDSDWTSHAGLKPVPELEPSGQTRTQSQNEVYVPTMPLTLSQMGMSTNKVGNLVEEEVQGGPRMQRFDNSGFFQQDSILLTDNISNSNDPCEFRYPIQPGGFGFFRQ